MKLAYQGEPGAYSEAAARAYGGSHVETLPCKAFDDVFAAVLPADAPDTRLMSTLARTASITMTKTAKLRIDNAASNAPTTTASGSTSAALSPVAAAEPE